MLIDTHCHLDASEFDADRGAVLRSAWDGGLARIVVPAVEAANFTTVRALAAGDARVRYALGIHPIFVDRARDEDLATLRSEVEASLDDPAFVGIGEIGLDYFVPGLDPDRQLRFFIAQLALAREFELPVICHVRRSQDAVLKQVRRIRPVSGIAHAFNGSHQQAGMFLDLGFALGFGGAFTWTRALQIRRLVTDLPEHAHVLETDAPDIPPAWIGKGRNAPGELPAIAQAFASLRGIDAGQVAMVTGANACRVLPRLMLPRD